MTREQIMVALFEFSGDKSEKGIFVAIAISSFNSLLSAINLSGSIFVVRSIFQILPGAKTVLWELSIQAILSLIRFSILSICSSVKLCDSSYNTFGSMFHHLKKFL